MCQPCLQQAIMPWCPCRKGAAFYDKRSRGHMQFERPFMLSVEDPNDPDNDLAKGSYNAPRVRQVRWMKWQLWAL